MRISDVFDALADGKHSHLHFNTFVSTESINVKAMTIKALAEKMGVPEKRYVTS